MKQQTKRERAESLFKDGHSVTQISNMIEAPRRTVNDWILKLRHENDKDIIKHSLKHEPFGTYRFGKKIVSDFGPGGHLALKLNKGITKTVVLSDLHMPYNIDLNPVFKFICDFKPDYIILNGDIADWDCFSPHEPCSFEKPLCFREQKDLCLSLISDLHIACQTSKIIWIQGNHEDWTRQAALRNPALSGLIEPHHWIPGEVDYVPLNHAAILGKLKILHGNCLRNERVAMPTRAMLQKWDGHVLFGHYHNRESYTQVSEIGSEKRHAEMSACLCHVNPSYSRNAPNAVTNGFVYIVSEKNGHYWPNFPTIHHGKFIAEGKLYE